MQQDHERYMHHCLTLASAALAAGDPPVGAILVYQEKIIGTGVESGKSTRDITNHAEILAVRNAIADGFSEQLDRSTMYTTHEPCIMCSYVLRHHRIPEIVFGTSVQYVGGFTSQFNVLSTENIPAWGRKPRVIGGICPDECEALTARFKASLGKL